MASYLTTTFSGPDMKPWRRTRQGHEHAQVMRVFAPFIRKPGQGVSTRVPAAATTEMALAAGACCLPHPEKAATGGEDAYFIASNGMSMGVADGVGGWRESGVDPGDYSRELMRTACAFFEENDDKRAALGNMKEWEEWARQALQVAHAKTRLPGSSTACVLVLNPESNWLSAANLGDSGFLVVRNGTVVFQTPALQHFFDCPYQFGAYPEYVEATDYPSDAQTFSLNVMAGDVIVMGSDGLFDNCPLDEIVALLPDKDEDVTTSAERVAALARKHASDPEFESPYILQALEQGMDLPWWEKIANTRIKDGKLQIGRLSGGKLDDITVLVARVSDQPVQLSIEEAPAPKEEAPAPTQELRESETASSSSGETQTSPPEESIPCVGESVPSAGVNGA